MPDCAQENFFPCCERETTAQTLLIFLAHCESDGHEDDKE